MKTGECITIPLNEGDTGVITTSKISSNFTAVIFCWLAYELILVDKNLNDYLAKFDNL